MRRAVIPMLCLVLLSGATAGTTDLHIAIEEETTHSSSIIVGSGCTIDFEVLVELGDYDTAGLAMLHFDLEFDGGGLTPAAPPTSPPGTSFVPPEGLSNPGGYGGTPLDGKLVQIGGSQNIFQNGQWACTTDSDCLGASTCQSEVCTPLPGLPIGSVVKGAALPGSPMIAASGFLTTPLANAKYTLKATNLAGNVLEEDAIPRPFWMTGEASVGAMTDLTVFVRDYASCEPTAIGGSGSPPAIPMLSGRALAIMALLLSLAGIVLLANRRTGIAGGP